MPLLSVITINYNNKEGLVKTVESVINQTFQDYEYIVIDGGSNDGSRVYLETQQAHFDYWISEADKGIYNAMNKGIQKANGDYCLFLNSGDVFFGDTTLQTISEVLLKEDIDILYGSCNNSNNERKTLFDMLSGGICHQAAYIRTSLFFNKKYNENYKIAADWEFFLFQFINEKKFKYIDEQLSIIEEKGVSNDWKLNRLEREQIIHDLIPKHTIDDFQKYEKLSVILGSETISKIINYKSNSHMFKLITRIYVGCSKLL